MSELRDALRAKLLQTRKPLARVVDFFGEKVELRQMKLSDVMKSAEDQANGVERKMRLINVLLDYAYVPGTEEKIFEEADTEALLEQPFGQDFINLSNALEELTQVNFTDKKPDSSASPSSSQ